MKVYVVYEYAVIEYEEVERVMGVYSSKKKAKEKIKEFEDGTKNHKYRAEYGCKEFELDED